MLAELHEQFVSYCNSNKTNAQYMHNNNMRVIEAFINITTVVCNKILVQLSSLKYRSTSARSGPGSLQGQ